MQRDYTNTIFNRETDFFSIFFIFVKFNLKVKKYTSMKSICQKLIVILLLLTILPCKSQMLDPKKQDFPFYNPSLSIDERVADLISRLTLEEKANQMLNV